MTRVLRNVAKFKRIYYNPNEVVQDDNLADQKMRKMVDEFKVKKKITSIKRNRTYIQ